MPLEKINGRLTLTPSPPKPAPPDRWHESDIPRGAVRFVAQQSTGLPVILVRDKADVIHAYAGRCPHMGADLRDAKIVDGCLACPWHGYRFSLSSGIMLRNPNIQAMAVIRNASRTFDPDLRPQYRLSERDVIVRRGWITAP